MLGMSYEEVMWFLGIRITPHTDGDKTSSKMLLGIGRIQKMIIMRHGSERRRQTMDGTFKLFNLRRIT